MLSAGYRIGARPLLAARRHPSSSEEAGGGGAYAAFKLPKNSVGTRQLKNNAVNGSKVKDRSLTGADIGGPVGSASSAAEAAHAANANHATNSDHAATAGQAENAAQLGGAAPSSFFPSAKVKRFDQELKEVPEGNHEPQLLVMGPLTLTMACNRGPSSSTIGILAASSAANARMYVELNAGSFSEGHSQSVTSTSASVFTRNDSGLGESGAGELVYRDSTTTIAIPFGYSLSNLFHECTLSGLALQS